MTYEEAIRKIKEFGLHHAIEDLPYSSNTVQAFEMAIEALKKVKESEETFEWCTDCKEYDHENYRCNRWNKRIRDTVEELRGSTMWIPCCEMMPEDGVRDEYLLTWREKWGDEPWDYHVDCCTYRCTEDKSNPYMLGRWEFNWDFWEGQKCEAVAWMPLPEPYKESDSE